MKNKQNKVQTIDNRLMPWQKRKQLNIFVFVFIILLLLVGVFVYLRLTDSNESNSNSSTINTVEKNPELDVRGKKIIEEFPENSQSGTEIVEEFKQNISQDQSKAGDSNTINKSMHYCMEKKDYICANEIIEAATFTDLTVKAEMYRAIAMGYESTDKSKALEFYNKAYSTINEYLANQPIVESENIKTYYEQKIKEMSQ